MPLPDGLRLQRFAEERGAIMVLAASGADVATIERRCAEGLPGLPGFKATEVLMAYASELDTDMRLLWLHAFVLWLEHDPVLDKESQEQIRAALKRLQI